MLACGLCALHWASPAFCLDDAYIHLAYVKSLKLGQGLSYNAGDWETGISSPLWVVLLALWPGAAPPTLAVKILGTLLHVAGVALMGVLPRMCAANASRLSCFTSAALWATTPLAVQAAVSGMEVSLAVALALAAALLALRRRYGLSAAVCGLTYLARPELFIYCALLSAGLALRERRLQPLWLLGGLSLAVALFAGYCLAVSGHPLPNTFYVKGRSLELSGLRYLGLEVLPKEPVVLSVLGVGLVALALWRSRQTRSWAAPLLFASALLALLATACSRALYPGVLFFQSRYFVPLLWILPLLAACGLDSLRGAARWVACGAMFLATAPLLLSGSQLIADQERGITTLHIEPARYLAAHADDVKVVGVEGAGALRYLTPASLRVVDLEGLNDVAIAHAQGNFYNKLCYLAARGVTHLAYPAQWSGSLRNAFKLTLMNRFTEPAYAQLAPPQAWQLTIAKVTGLSPAFAAFCAKQGGAP